MKILINYAHKLYQKAQLKNCTTGLEFGGFDAVIKYKFEHIDSEFYYKNKHILDKDRGAGYWLWKPYFIKKTMVEKMNDDDILYYCDAGHYFYNSIDHYIPHMENTEHKFLTFGSPYSSLKNYTKRDTLYYMNADNEYYHERKQNYGPGWILLKKNKFTLNFIEEWLEYSQDYRLITDSPNECGLPNYPEFIDHRHDQSIFNILCLKYNLPDPVVMAHQHNYGNPATKTDYQIMIYSGRLDTD